MKGLGPAKLERYGDEMLERPRDRVAGGLKAPFRGYNSAAQCGFADVRRRRARRRRIRKLRLLALLLDSLRARGRGVQLRSRDRASRPRSRRSTRRTARGDVDTVIYAAPNQDRARSACSRSSAATRAASSSRSDGDRADHEAGDRRRRGQAVLRAQRRRRPRHPPRRCGRTSAARRSSRAARRSRSSTSRTRTAATSRRSPARCARRRSPGSSTQRWSKDRILTAYLNTIYFGNGAYGIQQAAQTYFTARRAAELTLAEAALLAGIPARPLALRPGAASGRGARQRRDYVLGAAPRQGRITASTLRKRERDTPLPQPEDVRLPGTRGPAPRTSSTTSRTSSSRSSAPSASSAAGSR